MELTISLISVLLRVPLARPRSCRILLLATAVVLMPAEAAIVSRTILIDGDMSDWVGIRDNPGQFSTDAAGSTDPADLDYQVQATGRDLRKFSVTFDPARLYFYVERYASTKNQNDWWFYLDLDNDGRMQSGEPVFRVRWQGSNRSTERTLWTYIAADAALGDALVSDISGLADGHDMPGSISSSQDLDAAGPALAGGSAAGTEMETYLTWAELGQTGPTSLGFHIASSNGVNLPNQLDDNMDGITGNALLFADLGLAKVATPSTSLSGNPVDFAITLSNLGDADAANVIVNDDLVAAGLTYVSDDSAATATSYDAATGDWTIALLPAFASIDLNVRANATVTADQTFSNTAVIVTSPAIDTNSANDSASATVTYTVGATITKQLEVISDPVSGSSNPKLIPGALVDYYLDVANPSTQSIENVAVSDDLPAEMELFVQPLVATGAPFEFIDGGVGGGSPSGLTSNFVALTDPTDGLAFSNDGGATYTYVPTADAAGFDGNITNIRFTLDGTFNPAAPPLIPEFRLRLRTRLR